MFWGKNGKIVNPENHTFNIQKRGYVELCITWVCWHDVHISISSAFTMGLHLLTCVYAITLFQRQALS